LFYKFFFLVCLLSIFGSRRFFQPKKGTFFARGGGGGGGGGGINCPHFPAKKNCIGEKINKLLIAIACSVKMAKY